MKDQILRTLTLQLIKTIALFYTVIQTYISVCVCENNISIWFAIFITKECSILVIEHI